MNESSQDIDRRKRLHDWFKESPEIWKDISEELNMALGNEAVKLKSRDPISREWSAGYVYAYSEALDMERYFRKVWMEQKSHQQK